MSKASQAKTATPSAPNNPPAETANPAAGAQLDSPAAGDGKASVGAEAGGGGSPPAEVPAPAAKPKKPVVLSERKYEDGRIVRVLQDETRVWKDEVAPK